MARTQTIYVAIYCATNYLATYRLDRDSNVTSWESSASTQHPSQNHSFFKKKHMKNGQRNTKYILIDCSAEDNV